MRYNLTQSEFISCFGVFEIEISHIHQFFFLSLTSVLDWRWVIVTQINVCHLDQYSNSQIFIISVSVMTNT